jgi:quercetin dioxygenase-like cupin family protein
MQDYKAEIEAQDGLSAVETCEYTDQPKYEFIPNVLGRVLLSSERMTLFLVEIPAGGKVPAHSHPHEQMGICLNGEAQFISGTEKRLVHKGMVYRIGPNEMHEVQVIGSEKGLFLDIFCPPRTEYLSKQKLFEKDKI